MVEKKGITWTRFVVVVSALSASVAIANIDVRAGIAAMGCFGFILGVLAEQREGN